MRSGISCMSPRTQAPDLEEKRHFLPLPSLHMILVERQVEGVPVQAELLVESTLQFRGNVVFSIMGLEQALDQKAEFTCRSSPHDVQRVKEGLVELWVVGTVEEGGQGKGLASVAQAPVGIAVYCHVYCATMVNCTVKVTGVVESMGTSTR
jgi:hypothetical protein